MRRISIILLVAALAVAVNVQAQQADQPTPPPNQPSQWDDPRDTPPVDSEPATPPAVRRPEDRGPMPHAPLLRAIAQERPELAERLRRLWRESPERFREVIAQSLADRLEAALNEAERQEPRPGLAQRPPGERPPRPLGPPVEDERQVRQRRDLEQRNAQLDGRAHEIANRLQTIRREGAPPEAIEAQERELHEVVNAQFEVRTQLRHLELQRIEENLHRLQQMLDHMRQGLERRERARAAIIERRVEQLTGDELSDW